MHQIHFLLQTPLGKLTLLKNSVNIRTYHSVILTEPVPFTTIPFVYGNPWNEHLFRIFTEHCTPEMLLPRPWI